MDLTDTVDKRETHDKCYAHETLRGDLGSVRDPLHVFLVQYKDKWCMSFPVSLFHFFIDVEPGSEFYSVIGRVAGTWPVENW